MPRKKKAEIKKEEKITLTFSENHTAKRWIWAGVSSMTLIIAIFWIWSFKIGFARIKWSATPEGQLIESNYESWDKTVNSGDADARREYLKTQVKKVVDGIISESNASTSSATLFTAPSSTASSTADTTTTTTSTVNKLKIRK